MSEAPSALGRFAGVMFDFEGTLVDFQWRLQEAEAELREALATLGFPAGMFDGDSYATMWNRAVLRPGGPAEAALRTALDPVYDRWDLDALSRWRPRSGAASLLRYLSVAGRRLALVSNIGARALGEALDRFGFAAYLDPVVTRDDVRLMKPVGEGLRRCLEHWDLAPEQALLVGDSRTDIGAARDAGVRVAIIVGGESDAHALAVAPPDRFLRDLDEVAALV
jgi:phosphoglycolate phosphatase